MRGGRSLIALIITAAVLALIISLLFLPVSVQLKYEQEFYAAVRIAGIKVYGIGQESPGKKSKQQTAEDNASEKQPAENVFKRLKKKLGFAGAVKELFAFAKSVLERLKSVLKHLYFKKLRLDIRVATGDAADTAIQYGAVCAAVYPVLSLIDTCLNVRLKQADVSADFKSETSEITFSVIVGMRIIFLIIGAFALFSEYNNFKLRNEL